MLRTGDSETEILLGNKQLLGIFFIVAILLGVAFYGGYKVGKAAPPNRPAVTAAAQDTSTSTAPGGETHTIPSDTTTASATDAAEPLSDISSEPPLGSPRSRKSQTPPSPSDTAPSASTATNFSPEPGQTFLQVAAVGRDEALGVAHVLQSKGFRAHAAPKPGSARIYRVLVGPVRDAGDLSATRDKLRKTGFTGVIVQKY